MKRIFLNEILEDYQFEDDEMIKLKMANDFIKDLWNSNCKYRTYNKAFKFNINKNISQYP